MITVKAMIGITLMAVALGAGLVGTINNIRNAKGPRERDFAIRASLFSWLFVLAMLAGLYFTAGNYRYYILGAALILGPILLYKLSTTQQLIRMLDKREDEERSTG